MLFLLLSLLGLVPTFQKSRCKKLLNITMERIKLLSSRRDAQLRQSRNDLAKLLELGKQQKAQVWAGRMCKELQLRSLYAKIFAYCQCLQVNLTDIGGHSDCPQSLQEPLAGLCFAASYCADLPELQELRQIFTMKYGRNFVASAHELGQKCLVKDIEQELRQQQALETQMDAENCNKFLLAHHEEGADFVLASIQAPEIMQESTVAQIAFEEGVETAQALSGVANPKKILEGHKTYSKRQKTREERNDTDVEQGENTATVLGHHGSDQDLALYVQQPEFSTPPQRPPPSLPPPSRAPPLPPPRRSASMPCFSSYLKHETSSSNLSPSPCHCTPTMAKNQFGENYKAGIHVHPRLPKYDDLVANFTALKH